MAAQWVGRFQHRVSMLAVAAQGVMNVKEHPTHIILDDFATSLGDLANSLKELQGELEVHPPTSSIEAQQRDMEAEMTAMEQLVMAHRAQSQFSSLLSCPFLLLRLQSFRGTLSRNLEVITPVACSTSFQLQMSRTHRQLKESPPKLGVKEQTVIDSLSTITEGSAALKCKELADLVADYLGVALGDAVFSDHLAEAKRDVMKAEVCNDLSFSLYLDRCVKALEKGLAFQEEPLEGDHDFLSTPSTPQSINFATKEVVAPSAPLPSFICPITKQVMKDPVQIASGQTYERAAILQWFKDGKTTCPLGEKLKNTKVKSNYALRQSISEWKERNYNIRLDNAEVRLRSFQPMEQARGARDIKILCEDDAINKYGVASRKMIPLLIRLADTPTTPVEVRDLCFDALAALAQDHQDNQEILVFEGVIDVLIRSLRKYDEAEPAVNLLKVLSSSPKIAEIISRTPDAVLLLVTFLGHEKEALVVSVKAVLVNLPTTDENIVIMAKANLMKPLVTRLIEGGKESRIVMARTLAHLEHMPESSRSLANTREVINTLTNMMNSEDEEVVDAAILALKNLSTAPTVGVLIANCTGLEVLIRLLNCKSTSVITKVGASFVVAHVLKAVGNEWKPSVDRDNDIEHYIETIFILISSSTTTPPTVQSLLLQGLLGISKGKDTGNVVKEIMIRRNAFSVLLPHLRGKTPESRRDSLKLFSSLARKHGAEAWTAVKINSGTLQLLINMLKTNETSEVEKVAAARILSHFPEDDPVLTGVLRAFNIVPLLVSYLNSANSSLQEASLAALVRFTAPDSLDLQRTIAEMEVIPILVTLLDSRHQKVKISAARALANFSRSTPRLVTPVTPNKWWQCFKPPPDSCKLHSGVCSVERTFCLIMAEATYPLLNIVKEDDGKVTEVALEALYTLVDNDQWEQGCHIIHQADGISTIIRKLPKCTPRGQEISISMCEKFFRIKQYQASFGPMAQMHIITIAQTAAPKTKDVAGRILRQLELLQTQSHYWMSSTNSGVSK